MIAMICGDERTIVVEYSGNIRTIGGIFHYAIELPPKMGQTKGEMIVVRCDVGRLRSAQFWESSPEGDAGGIRRRVLPITLKKVRPMKHAAVAG